MPVEFLFLAGRIIFGGYFIMNGIEHFTDRVGYSAYAQSKGIPAPHFAVFGTGLLLLLGGAGVLFGVRESLSLFLLLFFLVPTTFMMHQFWKTQDPNTRVAEKINFFKNLALVGALLMLFGVSTPWVLSLSF